MALQDIRLELLPRLDGAADDEQEFLISWRGLTPDGQALVASRVVSVLGNERGGQTTLMPEVGASMLAVLEVNAGGLIRATLHDDNPEDLIAIDELDSSGFPIGTMRDFGDSPPLSSHESPYSLSSSSNSRGDVVLVAARETFQPSLYGSTPLHENTEYRWLYLPANGDRRVGTSFSTGPMKDPYRMSGPRVSVLEDGSFVIAEQRIIDRGGLQTGLAFGEGIALNHYSADGVLLQQGGVAFPAGVYGSPPRQIEVVARSPEQVTVLAAIYDGVSHDALFITTMSLDDPSAQWTRLEHLMPSTGAGDFLHDRYSIATDSAGNMLVAGRPSEDLGSLRAFNRYGIPQAAFGTPEDPLETVLMGLSRIYRPGSGSAPLPNTSAFRASLAEGGIAVVAATDSLSPYSVHFVALRLLPDADFCHSSNSELRCDMNADGSVDRTVTYDSTGTAVFLADWDGDGRADTCSRENATFGCDTADDGGSFESQLVFGVAGDQAYLGDLDGNGLADPCIRRGNLMLCDTARDGGRAEYRQRFGRKQDPVLLADVDGDGRADVCLDRRSQKSLLCDTGHDGGRAELRLRYGPAQLTGDFGLGDRNGDGRADLCARSGDRVVAQFEIQELGSR